MFLHRGGAEEADEHPGVPQRPARHRDHQRRGLVNAAEIQGKRLADLKIVVSGAGASAVACTRFYLSLGVKPENVLMVDSKGVLNTRRKLAEDDPKREWVRDTRWAALVGADMLLGLSRAGLVTAEMLVPGPEYIIPKPFDPRVLTWVASAVAKAAMDSGVAQVTVEIEAQPRPPGRYGPGARR